MTKSDYIRKYLTLSHNACSVKLKFHIGDFVSIPDEHIDCAVVVGSCIHENGIVFYVVRYVISDPLGEYEESYLPERLLVPYVDIGNSVDIGIINGEHISGIVTKVRTINSHKSYFVYNANVRFGVWMGEYMVFRNVLTRSKKNEKENHT